MARIKRKIKDWLSRHSIENKGLYYRLIVIFALFFLVPVFGFLYFAVKHDILSDPYVPVYFALFLLFSLAGLILLRRVFEEITRVSRGVTATVTETLQRQDVQGVPNEIRGIVTSFEILEQKLRENLFCLRRKMEEITTLKELSDLCYITFNREDLLHVTLERALKLVDGDIGSVMTLEEGEEKRFVFQASIGLGDFGKKGDRIPFGESIAKYAVINKSALLVEDIENDSRFGRASRPRYGTKSFICMPLKTMNDVIGVLTVSRRKRETAFTQEDVDALTPLLSNAAFTYDNLRLLGETEEKTERIRFLENVASSLNSSVHEGESIHLVFQELRKLMPFETMILLDLEKGGRDEIKVAELVSSAPVEDFKNRSFPCEGSWFGSVIKQQLPMIIDRKREEPTHLLDRGIFSLAGGNACLAVPCKTEGTVTGLLVLSFSREFPVPPMDSVVVILADILSLARSRQKLLLSVVKRNQDLETLRQIGSALSSSTFEMEKVLRYTMDMIRVTMNVEAGSLLLMEDGELKFRVAFNMDVKPLQNFSLKLGQGIAGYVAARGEPVMIRDARSYLHFYPDVDRYTGFVTRSVLCVPLISQSRVIGVIEVLNKLAGEFDDDDKHLLQAIATSVSIAMENARLYEETLTMAEQERSIRNVFQKFVPREIVDKIISGIDQGKPLMEEFRTLTLMNVDIRDFSKISRKIGPQKTVALLNDYFSIMGEIVFKREGILDKYLGDGFLAIFGAPGSSPRDATNAVEAALDMQNAMEGMNLSFRKKYNIEIVMGIGIHTGEVVIGNIGFEKRMDYTVIGDAVNVVFRLQELCKAWENGILISEKTCRALQTVMKIEKTGTCAMDDPYGEVSVYRVLGKSEDE